MHLLCESEQVKMIIEYQAINFYLNYGMKMKITKTR